MIIGLEAETYFPCCSSEAKSIECWIKRIKKLVVFQIFGAQSGVFKWHRFLFESMRFFLAATLLSVPGLLCETFEECIGGLFVKMSKDYPHHGCAAFRRAPQTSIEKDTAIDWYHWKFDSESPCWLPIYGVCIPTTQTGEWLKLTGDGGYENWMYNAALFHREGSKITLK